MKLKKIKVKISEHIHHPRFKVNVYIYTIEIRIIEASLDCEEIFRFS